MDINGFLTLWYSSHAALTFLDYLKLALGGLFGGVAYLAVFGPPKLRMPRICNGQLELGLVGLLLPSVILAIAVDFNFGVSVTIGMIAPSVIRAVNERIIPAFTKAVEVAVRKQETNGD